MERAEVLRQIVNMVNFKNDVASIGKITISLGISAFPDHGASGEELIKTADQALYAAKSEGRNCVRVAAVNIDADRPPVP
jgi:diguanylate cyclase (GGDEF)-like protein